MNPVEGDLVISAPLTFMAADYIQEAQGYIADRVFPVIPVDEQAGQYFTYDRGDFYRVEAGLRGPGSESRGGGFRTEQAPLYFAKIHAFHKDVDDQTAAKFRNRLNLEQAATEYVTQNLLLEREVYFKTTYMTTGVWGTDVAGVAAAPTLGTEVLQWDLTNSTPVADIRWHKRNMRRRVGLTPNTLVLTEEVRDTLAMHPDITGRYTIAGQTAPVEVSDAQIASALGIDRVVVASAIRNTANEGAADTFAEIYEDDVLLVYANPRPSILTPSGGYIFAWTSYPGANGYAERIKRFRLERNASWRIEGEMAYDMGLVTADAGVYINDVLS